ncbi:Afadin- and alpha-actinin-binding protein B [Sesamum angolense]|uniref:Afadin- and alpha-actinin-binding protein B n=1 Tax=Sesamum angolense TaxID=2727404 RepID=A0AAE1WG17_9LAMI|nr:Afadin- and alpha-actinin-binding protein B [Sesamum angolense]
MPPTEIDSDLRRSSANPSTLGMSECAFADINNLERCTKYLNQTLVTFGFPASLDLFSNDPVSVARTCNCMYALLQQRQRDIEFRESANEQRQRLLSDISRLEAKVERLEAQLSAKDRDIATMTRTEAKATAAFKAQIDKLQQERDEFQKMVLGNQQVRTQQIHEMKKKEKEYIKLQERLNQVLMEKKKESRSGIEIMNLLQKEGRQRGTWNGKKADNDFYKKIVDAYEAKNQELVAENADLRALLRSMQLKQILVMGYSPLLFVRVVAYKVAGSLEFCTCNIEMEYWLICVFLNAPNGKQSCPINERSDADPSQSPMGGRTDMFDLPLHMARDQIEESLRTKMASIKERMVQLQDAHKGAEVTSEVTERELELEAQLVEARSIIQEQASMMSKHLAKSERPRGCKSPNWRS